ncbi:MAG: DUF1622 domain-containing protein [Methylobacterium frigidaeris]
MGVEAIKTLTLWLATGTEAVAGLVIALAVVEAALRTARVFIRDGFIREAGTWTRDASASCEARTSREALASHEAKEQVRLRLGRWLALALEFELGADILRTAVAPTWSEIGQLAAIAAIRTILNFFLQQEIDKSARRQGGPAPAESPQRGGALS